MGSSSALAVARASETPRPVGRHTDHSVGDVLSDVARALWPDKTAEHLAAAARCEVRSAERYLGGQREWSGDAMAAIVAEICRRHGMRNIRVQSRD